MSETPLPEVPEAPEEPQPDYALTLAHLAGLALLLLLLLYARFIPAGASAWRDFTTPPEGAEAPPAAGWLARGLFRAAREWGAGRGGDGFAARESGGAQGLRCLHGALALLLGAAALAAYSRRAGGAALGALGLLLLFPAAPLFLGTVGAWLFGPVCFLALLALLARPSPGWLSLAAVPLLLAAWAALGASFVVGLLFLALFAASRAVDGCSEEGPRGLWRGLGPLAALAASAGLAALATPDGQGLYSSLWAYAASPGLSSVVAWQAPDFSRPATPIWLFGASLVLLIGAQLGTRRGFTPGETLLLLSFAALALTKAGALAWWFLLVPWLLMPRLAEWAEGFPGPARAHRNTVVGALLAAQVVVLVLPWAWVIRGGPVPPAQTLAPDVPWGLVGWLRAGPAGKANDELSAALKEGYPGGRFVGAVFATGETADYLSAALPAEWPVFLWGDPALAPKERLRAARAIELGRGDWWEVVDENGINLIVFHPGRDQALAKAVEDDPAWVVAPVAPGTSAALRRRPLLPGR